MTTLNDAKMPSLKDKLAQVAKTVVKKTKKKRKTKKKATKKKK